MSVRVHSRIASAELLVQDSDVWEPSFPSLQHLNVSHPLSMGRASHMGSMQYNDGPLAAVPSLFTSLFTCTDVSPVRGS